MSLSCKEPIFVFTEEKSSGSKTNTPQDKSEAMKEDTKVKNSKETATVPSKTSAETQISSPRQKKNYGPQDMVKVFIPVSICMLLVVVCARNIEEYKRDEIVKTVYVVYHDPEAEPPTKLWHSLVNAAVFIGVVAAATFGMLTLFYFRLYCCLTTFIMFSTFMLITVVSLLQYYEILRIVNFPVSIITVLFLHVNLAVVELMSLFWKGPIRVQQGTLILMSAMVTLTIMRVYPKWTSWTVLIALAFWDLFAVLSPCGPLKILVETAEERGEDLIPAIIYTGSASMPKTDSTQSTHESDKPVEQQKCPGSVRIESLRIPSLNGSEDEERNIRLGLGDFIFYSMLVGNATVTADWITTAACFLSILTGLGFTLVLLVVLQKALPALPISIAFGAIAFFSSKFIMSKFIELIYRRQIFI